MATKYPKFHVRSPGRLELLGNHTDYNGGWVIGVAINRYIDIVLQPSPDGDCHAESPGFSSVSVPFGEWRKFTGNDSWSNYVWGVALGLQEKGLLTKPFSLACESTLPPGSGLSSSAALEVGTAIGLLALEGKTLRPKEIIQLCRRAENEFVGVPSGILDQSSCLLGEAQKGVLIRCADETFEAVDFPENWHLTVLHSGVTHKLAESPYKKRFEECQEALRILRETIDHRPFLCAYSSDEVLRCREKIPEPYFSRALHVTKEQERVVSFIEFLKTGKIKEAATLLTASHESSRDFFGNSVPELDFLVESLNQIPAVLGSRLTGGGFGGGVLALSDGPLCPDTIETVQSAFAEKFGTTPTYFSVIVSEGTRLISYPDEE